MNAAIQRQVMTVTDCPACYRCGAVLAMDSKEYEGGD